MENSHFEFPTPQETVMNPQELDTLDLNETLAEILQAHGYACQTRARAA